MTLVSIGASSCPVNTVGLLLIPAAKPLGPFPAALWAMSASLLEKLGDSGGFLPAHQDEQAPKTYLIIVDTHSQPWLVFCSGAMLDEGHLVSWATLWEANNILFCSQIFLCPPEICKHGFSDAAVPVSSAPRSSAGGLHVRDPFKRQPHLL